uniref:Putative ORF5 n=1 Tax=Drosophila-associated filamentous virus TaxID=2743186 RepID=A0A6M9U053_9VIRU|nr:putative ORF5 [Drosophila-associated filamentous virus]
MFCEQLTLNNHVFRFCQIPLFYNKQQLQQEQHLSEKFLLQVDSDYLHIEILTGIVQRILEQESRRDHHHQQQQYNIIASIVYTVEKTLHTNFRKGTLLTISFVKMAFYYRNNISYYPINENEARIHNVIFKDIYEKLINDDSLQMESFMAYDYCEMLFHIFQVIGKLPAIEQDLLNDDDNTYLDNEERQTIQNLFQHIKSCIQEDPVKILKMINVKFVAYVKQMYNILSFHINESPNFIANKYMEHKMQYSLSTKHLKEDRNKEKSAVSTIATPTKTCDDDEDDDDDGDYDDFEDDYEDDDKAEIAEDAKSKNDNNKPSLNTIIYSKFFNDNGDKSTLQQVCDNLPLRTVHFNMSKKFNFIAFRLNIKPMCLQYLIDNFIIFSFRLLSHYTIEHVLDVVVYVYDSMICTFTTAIRRYINKHSNRLNLNVPVWTCRTKVMEFDDSMYNELTNGRFNTIQRLSEAEINVLYFVEMIMNANNDCINGKKLMLCEKKKYEFIDVYIVIEMSAFLKLLEMCSFSFVVKKNVVYKHLKFLYVHIYVHKIKVNTLYSLLNKLLQDETIASATTTTTSKTANINDPVLMLWAQRPIVQLLYSSDYTAFLHIQDAGKGMTADVAYNFYNDNSISDLYVRNILFHLFIMKVDKYSPIPDNIVDSNLVCFLLLRIAKSIKFEQKSFFYIKNSVDGPLNNIVSIKGISAIADNSINNVDFKCKCTTLCTMLNCPSFTGLQDPINATIKM